jgi:hypothetical protein
MKRVLGGVALALALTVVAAAPAEAQRPFSVGVGLGATFPLGDLGEHSEWGYHGMASLGFQPAMVPFGLRIDGMYHNLEGGEHDGHTDPAFRILGLNANAVLSMPGIMTTPYLIGGFGTYNMSVDVDGAESVNDMGVNVGLGARFSLAGFGTFAEARLHNIFTEGESTRVVPITFGIVF